MAEIDRGMEVGDLRKLLTKSKKEPVNAAVGIDGKNAVILLDKIKQPKILSKQLETKFKGLKSPRWGTAFVDLDEDPKLVILTLNRGGGGLGQKLKKSLKGTGFSKVRVQLEDGTIDEDVGEEDEATEGEEQEASTPSEPWNPAELTATLAGLVKKMIGLVKSAPDQLDELKQMATAAQGAIKSGIETSATEAVQAFAAALAKIEETIENVSGVPPVAPGPKAATLQKSGQVWTAAVKKVEGDIGRLKEAMVKHYDGQPFVGEIEKVFQSKVAPVLTTLDGQLAHTLEAASKASDPSDQQKLLGEAKQVMDRYESFVTGDPLIADLDNNPFLALQIQATVQTTLGSLRKQLP